MVFGVHKTHAEKTWTGTSQRHQIRAARIIRPKTKLTTMMKTLTGVEGFWWVVVDSSLSTSRTLTIGPYHSARGGGGEEEDELLDEGGLRHVAVLEDRNRRVADGTRAVRRLQRESSFHTDDYFPLRPSRGVTCQSTTCSRRCRFGVRIFGRLMSTTVSTERLGPEFNTCRQQRGPSARQPGL
ncbi:hypothetical protein EYF80_055015 [Liparis tanakae]|uniref:Uncharacterized protein n=1 Tax=Liparis tanakae TaxID=230148 RepID=A0A4Z2F0U5_9TELE|nr:hypothetical protein EYF80_055015 [Liparis tanakae]